MACPDNRIIPLASCRLYDKGEGDPVTLDHGFVWTDILSESHKNGRSNRTSRGEAKLEFLEGIGLVCRAFLRLQDTRLSHYTTTGGGWEERRPAVGNPRKYRLVQYSAAANTTWSATSTFNLPANPSVAFSLSMAAAPPDNDFDTYPPYTRIEFGNYHWALEFRPSESGRLLWKNNGVYEVALEFQVEFNAGTDGALNEQLIVLRHHRGKLGISTDQGKSYEWFGFPDGTPVEVVAGKLKVSGQGGSIVFGLHQIQYLAGTYTSAVRNTFTLRLLPVPTISGRYGVPVGTGVSFGDATSGTMAQYTATLTPAISNGTPFDFYSSPELYSVRYQLPVVRSIPTFAYTTPWDGDVLEIEIEKGYALADSSAVIHVRKDALVQFTGDYRWRKVAIILGELDSDGTTTRSTVAFVGYIREVRVGQTSFGEASVEIHLENATIHPRREVWCPLTIRPLGGQTVNQALDEILDSMGLTVAYRSWNPLGDVFMLPAGLPEDPFLLPKAGEDKWEWLQKIARFAGLEVAVTDAGIFSTGPADYVDPLVSYEWDAEGNAGVLSSLQEVGYHFNAEDSYTAVICAGTDEAQNLIWAFGVDVAAETNPANYRFCPWREIYFEEVEGTTTVPMLMQNTLYHYAEKVPLKFEAEITVPVNLNVLRRNRVRVLNTTVGIGNTDEFVVLTLQHRYVMDPSFTELKTTAGLRRLEY